VAVVGPHRAVRSGGGVEQQADAFGVDVAEAPAAPQERGLGDLEQDAAFVGGPAAVVALVVASLLAGVGWGVERHLDDDGQEFGGLGGGGRGR